MYSAVVFDLDGTLLDTLDDLADTVNFALSHYGLPVRTREEVCTFIGNGMQNLMMRASGIWDEREVEGLLATFKKHYAAHCKDKSKPYDGIIPLLRNLKAHGIKTAVLSNKADFATKELAKEYFDGLLDEAVGEDEAHGIRKKPCPDALFAIMQRFGVDEQETLYVGDSDVDIRTGENANVHCVSVTWGFRDRAFLLANGAKTFVSSPQEILDICLKGVYRVCAE